MDRFFILPEKIAKGRICFSDSQKRQMRDVLRLRTGSKIAAFDGSGKEYIAEIDSAYEGKIIDERYPETESSVRLTLIQGLPKGDKTDLIIQKCTEIGVNRIVFANTERSIPDIPNDRLAKKISRWQTIAAEAAEQSGRVKVPAVEGIFSLVEMMKKTGSNGIVAWEEEKSAMLNAILPELNVSDDIYLFIGPEGGFTEEEAQSAKDYNLKIVSLGRRILRTETAAIVGCSAVISGLEWLNK